MGIRPARAVRNPNKVAWTRFSRSKPRKSYIKAMPHQDLQQFRMGAQKPDFNAIYNLECEEAIIVRDNTLESARQAANKYLEKMILGNYYFIVRVFPHHVTRENKMIAGAGADRLQKGMRLSFGRPVDKAARVGKGQSIFTIHTYKSNSEHVRTAIERAKRKLSGRYRLVAVGNAQ